ncbi:MAG: 50S ribosomal protein L29 [Acidobacteria bacterium]|nr:50S ribosomal protein L29 [Acidobacteriota bacterium]
MPEKTKSTRSANAYAARQNKEAEKLRNLSDAELLHRQRELNDQLFRLKFQLKMGQTESLKKIRGLRKDIARARTLARGRALGFEPAPEQKA